MTTDKFGVELNVGDYAIYVPFSPSNPRSLKHGKITTISENSTFFATMPVFVYFENGDYADINNCLKFSDEQMALHKLGSNND